MLCKEPNKSESSTKMILAWRGLAKERLQKLNDAQRHILSLKADVENTTNRANEAINQLNKTKAQLRDLAQAGLDIVVGFQIRCYGPRIQLGNLEQTLEYNDTETAKAINLVVKTAHEHSCQGLELIAEYEVAENLWTSGPFGAR
jgi:hypothetical protein